MPLTPGAMVTANVRLVGPLAEGSMGAVWVADHLTLKTQVAVKFIAEKYAIDDPDVQQRFEHEASTAAQIKSHHVVQTFDHGVTADGTPYIVLELLEGESLETRLDRAERLSVQETAIIVQHVARALGKAHEIGIVHRDIKPANIFLTTSDEGLFCKVLDFGIAKRSGVQFRREMTSVTDSTRAQIMAAKDKLTMDGILIGTPQYMSPEQVFEDNATDYRADLWALSVVAYECLTGRTPFGDGFTDDLWIALSKREYTPVSERQPDLPPAVDEFFARAFPQEGEAGFTSARELTSTFRALAASPGLGTASLIEDPLSEDTWPSLNSTPGMTTGAQLAPPVKKGMRLAPLVAVGAVVGGVVMSTGWFLIRDGGDPDAVAASTSRDATESADVEPSAASSTASSAPSATAAAAPVNAEVGAQASASAPPPAGAAPAVPPRVTGAVPVAPPSRPASTVGGYGKPKPKTKKDLGF